ncbi:MAG: DUF4367 domain-containing protein [Oscillospiraceae bacterium]|nr:DUF4367 domain-containing protein [Oscillospiraceae bacterium]
MPDMLRHATVENLDLLMDTLFHVDDISPEQVEFLRAVVDELRERGEIPDVTEEENRASLEAMRRRIQERANAPPEAAPEDTNWMAELNGDILRDRARAAARFRRFRNFTVSAMAAVVILFLFHTVAEAAGYSLLGSAARWSKGAVYFVFGVGGTEEFPKINTNAYDKLKFTLDRLGVHAALPDYIPDGFIFDSLEPEEPDEMVNLVAWFASEEGFFSVSVSRIIPGEDLKFNESDGAEHTELYSSQRGEFFITTNMGRMNAIWYHGIYEIVIQGNLSYEQLIQMLDSI